MRWYQDDFNILQDGRKTQPYKPQMLKNAWADTERRAWLQNCSMQHILSSCHHGLRAKYSFQTQCSLMGLLRGIAVIPATQSMTALRWPRGPLSIRFSCDVPLCLMENSSSPPAFDSQPRPRMSEKGLPDTRTKGPLHTQWKNWHVSDRAEREYRDVGVNKPLAAVFLLHFKCCLWRLIVSEDWFRFV